MSRGGLVKRSHTDPAEIRPQMRKNATIAKHERTRQYLVVKCLHEARPGSPRRLENLYNKNPSIRAQRGVSTGWWRNSISLFRHRDSFKSLMSLQGGHWNSNFSAEGVPSQLCAPNYNPLAASWSRGSSMRTDGLFKLARAAIQDTSPGAVAYNEYKKIAPDCTITVCVWHVVGVGNTKLLVLEIFVAPSLVQIIFHPPLDDA
ncbi:hypothetical protein EDD16DRAFT_1731080 [Pisolithus croceorrhizus]|nr:hypothetical protein EV401DRAFT_2202626 [Pisolithus croceorrhizus]KAI6102635.1 hypothetical protein EDD16DRAFT_1731080 [Pisolithus croceorrhizus]